MPCIALMPLIDARRAVGNEDNSIRAALEVAGLNKHGFAVVIKTDFVDASERLKFKGLNVLRARTQGKTGHEHHGGSK